MFRGCWKIIMCITSSIIMLTSCISCSSFWEKIQTVGEGYQCKFEYKGTLEKKYAYDGEYQVELFTQEDSDERIKLLQVYYPANLKTEQRAWPLVLMANGTGIRASKYKAVFRHLASWGFIVVGNEDEWTWDGPFYHSRCRGLWRWAGPGGGDRRGCRCRGQRRLRRSARH